MVVFCYKDIHVDQNEDNKSVSSCPQSTTSESLTVNMTSQIKMRAIRKTLGGAWCNRMVAKQEDSHSTAPADKQINE